MAQLTKHAEIPLVSVVIPAYNCERYLARAITSALNQDYPNLECIVIDDGSTDGTAQIIESFGDRIRPIFQSNKGASAARNMGIAAAQGKYIAFLDADDYWLNTKTANQMGAFREVPDLVMVSCDFEWKTATPSTEPVAFEGPAYDARQLRVHRDLEPLLRDPYLGTPSVIVDAEAIRAIGGFNVSLPIAEDVDLYFRLCANNMYARLNQRLVCFQHSPGSLTKQLRGYRDNLCVLSDLECRMPELSRRYAQLLRLRRIEIYTWWIKDLLYCGDGRNAREVIREARTMTQLPGSWPLLLKSFIAPTLVTLRRFSSASRERTN